MVTARGDFPQQLTLDHPGDQVSLFCTTRGPSGVPFYCLTMENDASSRKTVDFSLAANTSRPSTVGMCVSGPGLSRCFTDSFDAGFILPDIVCSPRRAGVFTMRWRVGGRLLGTLQSPPMPGGGNNRCTDMS